MSCSFANCGDDPDLVTYQNYMNKGSPDQTNKVDQAIRKHRINTGRLSMLPGLKVNVLFSAVNILMLSGLRHCKNQGRGSPQYQRTLP